MQTLLPYYCAQGKKILYLVNSRILKEQIREMIVDLPHEQFASIRVDESKLTEESESRSRVIAALNKIVGKKMVREECQNFVDGILTDLRVLAAHPIDFPGEQERTNAQFEKWNTNLWNLARNGSFQK